MIKKIFIAVSLAFILMCPMVAQAQISDTIENMQMAIDDSIESAFDENLDSLANSWFVEESVGLDSLFPDLELTLKKEIPEFSDSVYIDRLSRIPSVVDLSYNKIVKRYIEVYTKERREKVKVMLGLADYYFPIFDDIFDYYDVPNEMKYMSIIESALNPLAYSRTRAVGLWQFMYGTGKMYGLTINSYVDERRDPIKSTHAAARFAKDLYKQFGDWVLVIAAYNCGPGNVRKAIRRSGGKTNYWDIYYYLPRETRGHVPAFIAATYLMHYYEEHNFTPVPIELPLASDTIMVNRMLHFEQVSHILGIPVKELKGMNPQYRLNIVPGTHKPYALRIPDEYIEPFIDLEDSIYAYKDSVYFNPEKLNATPNYTPYAPPAPGKNYTKLYYRVNPGDNLGLIAEAYHVRISDLRYWNNIRRNLIRSGQRLVIYVPNSRASRYKNITSVQQGVSNTASTVQSEPENGEYIYYTVKYGDTLWDIAKKYPDVSETDIMKLNSLSYNDKIHPGQRLRIKRKS